MDAAAFRSFTLRLLERLAEDAEVLGLVALGSMSGLPPEPDAFSDHDFFVVVAPGAQERLRTQLSWLPDASEIALSFRETAHGVKALWTSGHLAEFAIFAPDELPLARVNRYRVLLDRSDVGARMARVHAATLEQGRCAAPDERWSAGQLLACLVVGAGRWARGERLSGHQLVRATAVGHLLTLLRARVPPAGAGLLDDLDGWRRFERALPEAGAQLDAALALPVPAAARVLLSLLVQHRPELATEAARLAVLRALDAAERSGPGPGVAP